MRRRSVAGRPAEDGQQTPTGSRHHLICDGRGTPLKVIMTAANVNDVTQTLALVDGIPPVAGRPGRPRRHPEALLGDQDYDSHANRDEPRKRRILPVISRKGAPNIQGRGKPRNVVEQTFALLHHSKRLAVRWERHTELHDAFVSPACRGRAGFVTCDAKPLSTGPMPYLLTIPMLSSACSGGTDSRTWPSLSRGVSSSSDRTPARPEPRP
ncbi:transposase [Streptomyces spectabilis]|uniref:transposase n=1 Tax=Streptomyces spectabilis TaxID=68270 RepID=UPI0039A4C5CC